MEFVDNTFRFQTNLGGSCFDKLQAGTWKIGLFADNPCIENESSDEFYENGKGALENTTSRHFKNKVCCTLYDKSRVEAHIIHLHGEGRWFCVTFDTWWDQF